MTLTETITSLSLFFLVVILIFNIYPGSLIGLRKSEQRTQAVRVAQTALSEARGRGSPRWC